jgi:hypothetical protein
MKRVGSMLIMSKPRRRIDGINFQPPSDTRCGAERKSRLKHVECVRRASPADAGESDRAADGSAEGDE